MSKKKEPIKIIIPINPVTKKNSQKIIRTGRRYMIVPSEVYKRYELDCYPYLIGHKYGINEPVNIQATYYRATRHLVDLCNLHEALCDVLVKYGVVEDDNSRIIATMDGSRVCYDKDFPRTEVLITYKKNL